MQLKRSLREFQPERPGKLVQAIILLATSLVASISFAAGESPAQAAKIVIGSKNSVGEKIMGEMMAQLLRKRGFDVQLKEGLSSLILRAGMKSGSIDICADYTGTAYFYYLEKPYSPGMGSNRLYELLRQEDAKNGLIWLDPIWNDHTFSMVSWPVFVKENDLTDLSSLADLYNREQGKIMTAVDFEFSVRPDGVYALQDVYGFTIAVVDLRVGPPALPDLSLKMQSVRVAQVFATDPAISKYGWHVYEDDKEAFPPNDLTPCIRKQVMGRHPEIAGVLNNLVRTFPGGGAPATKEAIEKCRRIWRDLNGAVIFGNRAPKEVAWQYLRENGLIR